jgi:hypothetical protein
MTVSRFRSADGLQIHNLLAVAALTATSMPDGWRRGGVVSSAVNGSHMCIFGNRQWRIEIIQFYCIFHVTLPLFLLLLDAIFKLSLLHEFCMDSLEI